MKRRRWPRILLGIIAIVAVAGVAVFIAYANDLATIEARVAAGSAVADTPLGKIEYAEAGEGTPLLVLHGAGGGYDQGLLIGATFAGDNFHIIAPSRFGYLRSPLSENASTEAEAEALAALLDHLGIGRVAVMGMSGGVPPALQFAKLYPERTAALILLSSAPYTPLTAASQDLPMAAWLYQALFSTNFPYWVIQKLSPHSLDAIFDVKPEMRANMAPEDDALVSRLIDAFQPVTGRVAGLANEGGAIDPAARYGLDAIQAPTLVIHAEDDGINPFPIGEYTAAHVPGAEFMPLASGGHLLLGHQAEVRARVSAFLATHGDSVELVSP